MVIRRLQCVFLALTMRGSQQEYPTACTESPKAMRVMARNTVKGTHGVAPGRTPIAPNRDIDINLRLSYLLSNSAHMAESRCGSLSRSADTSLCPA